jgi:hypothetical protein
MDHIYYGHSAVAVSPEIGLQGQDVLSQILPSFFVLGLYNNSSFILSYHDLINIYKLFFVLRIRL